MAFYMFVEGLSLWNAGGVTAKGYERDWFEIEGISFDLSRTESKGSQGAGDEVKLSAVTFSKNKDAASPSLFLLTCSGQRRDVKCHVVKTGEKKFEPYVEYDFKQAMFMKYAPSGETEQCSFSCEEIKFTYRPADKKGKLLGQRVVQWKPRQRATT